MQICCLEVRSKKLNKTQLWKIEEQHAVTVTKTETTIIHVSIANVIGIFSGEVFVQYVTYIYTLTRQLL